MGHGSGQSSGLNINAFQVSRLTSRGRDDWPDEKDEQEDKLQGEKVETKRKRKETKVKERQEEY